MREKDALSQVYLFRELTPHEMERLLSISKEKKAKKNEVIFKEGDIGDAFYLIVTGSVRISTIVPGVGEEALTPRDRKFLGFADIFEKQFIAQLEDEDRSIEETLGLGWELMSTLPKEQLTRIDRKYIEQFWPGA